MKTSYRLTTTLVLGFAVVLTAQQPSPTPSDHATTKSPTDSQVVSARFSPDGRQVVTAAADGTARVWDAKTGAPLSPVAAHQGAWQLASYKYGDSSDWSEAPSGQRRIKLITGTHFTWVAYDTATRKVVTTAGGTYTLEGEAYTETLEFAGEGVTDYVGKKQSFKIRVEGDTLKQSGQLSDGTKIEEVWQRIK